MIERADWAERKPYERDYVSNCIEAAWRIDGAELADHLAAMLRERPSLCLRLEEDGKGKLIETLSRYGPLL